MAKVTVGPSGYHLFYFYRLEWKGYGNPTFTSNYTTIGTTADPQLNVQEATEFT